MFACDKMYSDNEKNKIKYILGVKKKNALFITG